jgi:hypothetical protein
MLLIYIYFRQRLGITATLGEVFMASTYDRFVRARTHTQVLQFIRREEKLYPCERFFSPLDLRHTHTQIKVFFTASYVRTVF